MSPQRFARTAGWVTLAVTVALLGLLIRVDNLGAWFTLLAPVAAGLLAILFPANRSLLLLAFGVLAVGHMPMLFGGVGAFYWPALGLLLAALLVPPQETKPTHSEA